MKNFDPRFTSPEHYIRDITATIWEGRQVERIHDWYSADCAVVTPSGTQRGVAAVVRGTLETLAQFPDRRLLCEDVIVAEQGDAFLSSHRIASPMTHRGDGSFGPASGRAVFARTVADCVCRNNRIVHEWLVRDQAAIALAVGRTPRALAEEWLAARGPVALPLVQPTPPVPWQDPMHTTPGAALLRGLYEALWAGELETLAARCDEAVQVELPAGTRAVGVAALEAFWFGLTAAFAGARLHIHSLAEFVEPGRTPRVAMRWRVVGQHNGQGRYGAPSGRPVEMLGITHAEIDTRPGRERILREWILIDDVALWMQLLAP
jgi:ketosteroid isomerase-like protein